MGAHELLSETSPLQRLRDFVLALVSIKDYTLSAREGLVERVSTGLMKDFTLCCTAGAVLAGWLLNKKCVVGG